MRGLWLDRPWRPLDPVTIESLPAQLGVYEIGDETGAVVKIGYAGGRSTFGMRSALHDELAAGTGTQFRHEFTHGYLTRFEELLMVHVAEHGDLPSANDQRHDVGRLHLDPTRAHGGA
ncbi:MAG: hypothetical protein R2710_25475 [Acidimicrobiales bacterium]